MGFFKRFEPAFWIFAIWTVAACSFQSSDPTRGDSIQTSRATFEVLPAELQTAPQPLVTDDIWREKSFNVKVCLRDTVTLQPIVGMSFAIRGGAEEISRTTNTEGCLFWPERVRYNYLARESFGTLHREISGQGLYSGVIELPMAVDPWKEGFESFADLRTRSVPRLVSAPQTAEAFAGRSRFAPGTHLREKTPYPSNLLLNHAEVSFRSEKTEPSPRMTLDVTLSPSILHGDIDERYEQGMTLQRGRFRLELALMEVSLATGSRSLIARGTPREAEIQQGQLVMTGVEMSVVATPQADFLRPDKNRFRWELFFKLTPIGEGMDGLMPAEGVLSYQPGQGAGALAALKAGTLEETLQSASEGKAPPAALRPRVLLRDFSYQFQGRGFEVDKYLQLSQTRDYEMIFSPELYHPFSFQTGGETREPLRPGERVRVRALFVAGTPAPGGEKENREMGARLLSRFDTEAVVGADGKIHFQVPLKIHFSEEPYLDSVTSIIVEISSPDDARFDASSSFQQLDARTQSGQAILNPLPGSIDDWMAKLVPQQMGFSRVAYGDPNLNGSLMKPELPWQKSPMDLFMSSLKGPFPRISRIDVDAGAEEDPRLAPLKMSKAELRELILSERYQKRKMVGDPAVSAKKEADPREVELPAPSRWCRFWSHVGLCKLSETVMKRPAPRHDPNQDLPVILPEFNLQNVKIVEDIVSAVGSPQVRDLQWQVTAGFLRARDGYRRDYGAKAESGSWEGGAMGYVNAAVETEAGFKLFGTGAAGKVATGVVSTYGWVHRNQTSEVVEAGQELSTRDWAQIGEINYLYGEQRTFQLDLVIHDCLLLTPNSISARGIASFLVCAKRRERRPESWYYLADFDFTHSPQPADMRVLRERLLIKLIRGQGALEDFRERISGASRRYELLSARPYEKGVSSLLDDAIYRRDNPAAYFQEGGIFPGVLSLPP